MAAHPVLVPEPLEVKWSAPLELAPGSVAIVLGQQAAAPEQTGARLLQEFVAKRFGQKWPVVKEGDESPGHKVLIVLGQRTTSRRVDELCGKHSIHLSEAAPGQDGYVIDVLPEGGRTVVLVGGSNARGVAYGQDTLSQMLSGDEERLALAGASVRDAPLIRWRGRPQTAVSHYLRPGELDLYVSSRINFIDLRGGIYAFEGGEKLNQAEIKEAVAQAHARGLVVFGTVNCGVPAGRQEQVLGTFKELLALGADGLWLSFDDKGPGEDPVALVQKVLELGRAHNLSGQLIAITPPKGSYQKIATDFNRKLMAIPGMDTALWFWTGVPGKEPLAEARSLGLKVKPGWWHNWPRLFTSHQYTGLPALSLGWHQASYEALADSGECLDAVMPWGGNSYGQHYVVPTIGWWGWNPKKHDGNALRSRVFSTVFGPGQAAAAMRFDDALNTLFSRFHYAAKDTDELPLSPPRLNDQGNKAEAQALIAELTGLLEQLERAAPGKTLLSTGALNAAYLTPMRRELETHRQAVNLAYPEEWWPEHQRKILDELYAGETNQLNALLEEGRARVLSQIDQIGKALPAYPHLGHYVKWWRTRAQLDANGWRALLQSRKAALKARLREYGQQVIAPKTMLDGLASPPLEWGIGRWQVSNRVLATITPSANEYFWGDWLAGLHGQGTDRVAAFAADRRTPGDIGEYAELQAVVPISGNRTNLALLLFVSSANKDLFSNTLAKYRWAGYRFLELLWQDKVLWEADLGRVSERGEWFMVRLPPMPEALKELPLRLRVEDRKLSLNNYTICFVGPLRLMEVP